MTSKKGQWSKWTLTINSDNYKRIGYKLNYLRHRHTVLCKYVSQA